MPMFRKRPDVVQAEQFNGGLAETWPEGVFATLGPTGYGIAGLSQHGHVPVEVGDWIVSDGKGGQWRCEANDFEASYEPVAPRRLAASDLATAHLNSALECWEADDLVLLKEHIWEAIDLLADATPPPVEPGKERA